MAELIWERVDDFFKEEKKDLGNVLRGTVMRAEVPGGWLVRVLYPAASDETNTDALTFVPDPNRAWK